MTHFLVQCKMEGLVVECGVITADILTAIRNLDKWAECKPVDKDLPCALQLSSPYTKPDPLGVVAIFGAWNYPVQLILLPLIGAIAAGNAVLMKPSEVAVATSNLMANHLPKYLDQVSTKFLLLGFACSHTVLLLLLTQRIITAAIFMMYFAPNFGVIFPRVHYWTDLRCSVSVKKATCIYTYWCIMYVNG